jgi:putative NIF3 family GTP cyclohydrolase 1 type 2
MASRDEIVAFCDELLEIGSFEDYGPNGLQVPGAPDVSKLATGVSANRAFIEGAIESGAQLAITHHGLFWGGEPQALSEQMAERLRALLTARVSLAAYHLPLDAHREIGNNAQICELLGFEQRAQFAEVRGRPIGIVGSSAEGIEAPALIERVTEVVERRPLTFEAGPGLVRSIGIVSGGPPRRSARRSGSASTPI